MHQSNDNENELEDKTKIFRNYTPAAPIPNFEETLKSDEYQKLDEFIRNVDPYAQETEDRVIEGYKEVLSDGEFRRQQATEWGKELHKEFQERDKDVFAEKEITLRTSDGKAVRPDGISLDEDGERDGRELREIKTYIPNEEKLGEQLDKNIDAATQEYGRVPESYQVDVYEPGNLKDVTTNMHSFLDAYGSRQEEESSTENEGGVESENESESESESEGESESE